MRRAISSVAAAFSKWLRSVANELKQLKVPGEVISELLCHKVDSITMSRYGKRYRPAIILDAFEKFAVVAAMNHGKPILFTRTSRRGFNCAFTDRTI